MEKQSILPLPPSNVRIEGGFLGPVSETVRKIMLPYQWKVLNDELEGVEPSHCLSNFKIAAGAKEGSFGGMVFQDSDLAKWLEAAAYSLAAHPDAELERWAEEAIEWIGHAQQPDGYLDTYFIIKEPDKRWANLRDCHELYCAGHMMEAAVAYYEATGRRKLLDIMLRTARHIADTFGPEDGQLHGYPGHEEIELALVRMYRVTGEEWLNQLAKYFIDERGKQPYYFVEERRKGSLGNASSYNDRFDLSYCQSHLPVREQTTMEGHSVRALYLLSGMIDVAASTNDAGLLASCRALFDNVTKKRMYITGGVGSTHVGEAFTFDYDLPNDTVYAETCASIALIFAAQRLLLLRPDGAYADIIEQALYNTCLAGMSLNGRRFFYVNPLEVSPKASRSNPDRRHVLPERPLWFGCACCPPNLARLICSLSGYAYGARGRDLYLHLYVAGRATFEVNGRPIELTVETEYPRDGRIVVTARKGAYALHMRLPGWCRGHNLTINGAPIEAPVEEGYLVIDRRWAEGDRLELTLPMPPRRVYAHPDVASDAGCVAIVRGPVVYCAEQADNGSRLWQIRLPRGSALREEEETGELGQILRITADAYAADEPAPDAPLYSEAPTACDRPVRLSLIPYYAWANRGAGEMRVWLRE